MKAFVTYIVLALFLANCGTKKENETEANEASGIILSEEQFSGNNFSLGTLIQQDFEISVQTTGMIDVPPQNKAIVTAPLGGFVKNTHLIVGDNVTKGQPMVTIENQEFVRLQKEYLTVYNNLEFLQSEYQRNKTLLEENITSEKNFLQAKSNYEMAKANYLTLQKQLQMVNISPKTVESGTISSQSTLYAPISGSVTQVNVNKGSYVSPSSEIIQIVDNDHLHLELIVFEKDALKIKKGQHINFLIPETGDTQYQGEVYLVGTAVDETNRTIKVHGHPNTENKLLTGMFVEASIQIDSKKALALPENAVVEKDGDFSVLVLSEQENGNYKFEERLVTIGSRLNSYVEILNTEDFEDGTQFLINGAFELLAN
ncbi:hemolysin D [Croceivirga lutea]|uniref:efflux RND transporter periplasmic adaptor subunit n=1 Tax=Croceivirga lutea TaxID=1775167 RepID=UPI00163983DA|nr:efflux RND transporter periplasmic adaptor subunit [Croceivirga lutea]GGG40533.1 hemolysin D [Croceivirga lutea]